MGAYQSLFGMFLNSIQDMCAFDFFYSNKLSKHFYEDNFNWYNVLIVVSENLLDNKKYDEAEQMQDAMGKYDE